MKLVWSVLIAYQIDAPTAEEALAKAQAIVRDPPAPITSITLTETPAWAEVDS